MTSTARPASLYDSVASASCRGCFIAPYAICTGFSVSFQSSDEAECRWVCRLPLLLHTAIHICIESKLITLSTSSRASCPTFQRLSLARSLLRGPTRPDDYCRLFFFFLFSSFVRKVGPLVPGLVTVQLSTPTFPQAPRFRDTSPECDYFCVVSYI